MGTLNETLSPNHPAAKMIAALESETMRVERAECAAAGLPASDHPAVQRAARVLDAARSKNATTNAHLSILTALEYLTADDLRATPAGQALMAEAWSKFQEHYAAEWEEAYPEDIFPSPAPPPAVVSRESVSAFMMRHWAERLRTDRNPYQDGDA